MYRKLYYLFLTMALLCGVACSSDEGGEEPAPGPGGLQLRQVEGHTGGAEDDILREVLEVVFPQNQGNTQVLELFPVFPQFGEGAAVPGGDEGSVGGEELHQGQMAASDAAEGDAFAVEGGEKLLYVHGSSHSK